MRTDPLRRHEHSLASADWSARPTEPAAGKRTVSQALAPYQAQGGAAQLEQARQRLAVLESSAGDPSAMGWQLAGARQALRDAEEEAADAQHDDRRGEIADLRARLCAIETRMTENPAHHEAARGVHGASEALPFLDVIQRAFGRHGVGHIRARVGGQAAAASDAIGARAYAFGDRVGFAGSPDLHTAAHEAAHVVQQRAGLGPASGVGSAGDRYEVDADRIADAVVAGRSAEALIDRMLARGGGAGAAVMAVQRDPKHGATIATTPPASEGAGYAMSEAAGAIRIAREVITTCAETLVPAFRKAVDAIDPPGAIQLAQAAVAALDAATTHFARASERAATGDPYERARSVAGAPLDMTPVAGWEIDEAASLRADLDGLGRRLHGLERYMLLSMSPQIFRGQAVLGSVRLPPGAEANVIESVVRESATTIDLLVTYVHVKELLGADPRAASADAKRRALDAIQMWRSRPLNFRFLHEVLEASGLRDILWNVAGSSGEMLRKTHGAVLDQAHATGNFADVGTWDAHEVDDLLSRGLTDWAITDDDAMSVLDMIASAAPSARGKLVLQLESMGKLGALCDNLPWRRVQELHDAIDDRAAKAALRPHFQEKGGGESLSKLYDRGTDKLLDANLPFLAFELQLLKKTHNAVTFGFLDEHDAAYDASEEGFISDDAYTSTSAKAAGRAAVMMAASLAAGGVAGPWGEGVAQGLGANQTLAQIIGGGMGGAAAGVTGQLTSDVYDHHVDGQIGLSSAADYGYAAAAGGVSGAIIGGLGAAGSKFVPDHVKTMGQRYAEKFPELDNVLTRIRNAGIRQGLVTRVTAQELRTMIKARLLDQGSLDRIAQVAGNDRIDVSREVLSKVYPRSKIEEYFGDVDRTTGHVTINKPPAAGGFVGVERDIPAVSRRSAGDMRDLLGINGSSEDYQMYMVPNDPLFEVTFRTGIELGVPLPQESAAGTRLGGFDPRTQHRPGTGLTMGDVREGRLSMLSPIEIVDIRPVGIPRTAGAGFTMKTSELAPVSARNLVAPLTGGTSQMCTFEEDH